MIARTRSMCPRCDELIHPGNEIEPVPTRDEQGRTGYVVGTSWAHVVCPEATEQAADVAALTLPRCGRCGLNHPGEC